MEAHPRACPSAQPFRGSPCTPFALTLRSPLHSPLHSPLRALRLRPAPQWDGIRSGPAAPGRVVVLGATNRPHDLDDAVLRRFSRRVFCDLPDAASRRAILQVTRGRAARRSRRAMHRKP
jgi:SpoVK/Ycf46/Vps4 family AAA+-type ATPase